MTNDPWLEEVFNQATRKYRLSRETLEQVVDHFRRATPFPLVQDALGISAEILNQLFNSNLRRVAFSKAAISTAPHVVGNRRTSLRRIGPLANYLPPPETVQAVAELIRLHIPREVARQYLRLSDEDMHVTLEHLKRKKGTISEEHSG